MDSNEPIVGFDPAAPPPPPVAPATPAAPAKQLAGENPVFNLWDVLLIFVTAAVSLFFCSLFALLVIYATHQGSGRLNEKQLAGNILVFLPAQVAAYILTVGFMVFLIWQKYRMDFLQAVKWNMPEGKMAWGALGVGAGLAVATQLASAVLHPWIPKSLPIEQYFRTPASAYALAAFGILVAPFVEELFFRGFLFPALARPLGLFWSTIITAFGFALIHGEQLAHAWIPLLLLFSVGTVLTLARAKTKSVAVSVLIHIGYNTTLFTILYIATHGFRRMDLG
ncbi:MAG TPA: type II CAAX endopeptidase family protein [Candidatus Angelobacter sp.]|nr:type II CAAX endopeptidase family protein [Candidatus Angelobacter sp.]